MSTKHLIFVTTLCGALFTLLPVIDAVSQPFPSSQDCKNAKKPDPAGSAAFFDPKCDGKPKERFPTDGMSVHTGMAGERACGELTRQWDFYCLCKKSTLEAKRLDISDMEFVIIDCNNKKPEENEPVTKAHWNWMVTCGEYKCVDAKPKTSSSSSTSTSTSSTPSS